MNPKSSARVRRTVLAAGLMGAGIPSGWAQADAALDMPVVPASVLKVKTASGPLGSSSQAAVRTHAPVSKSAPSVLEVRPGVNQMIPVAVRHLNRLVTPFAHPNVATTSTAHTEVRGRVVYVATDSAVPVTLFITENGDESEALSLTLMPQRIPPREIVLRWQGHRRTDTGQAHSRRAAQWEESQPYVATLKRVLRATALGQVPPGYSLQRTSDAPSGFDCRQAGLDFDFQGGQHLIGQHLQVHVGLTQNVSRRPVTVREASCAGETVAAVAAWPKQRLKPGQKTELYVVTKVEAVLSRTDPRPSLLDVQP